MQGRFGLLAIVVLIAGCAAPTTGDAAVHTIPSGPVVAWLMLGAAGVVLAALIQGLQMRASRRAANQQRHAGIRQATIDFIANNRERTQSLDAKINSPPQRTHVGYSAADRREFDRWWNKSARYFCELADYWNQLAAGVSTGAFDIDTIHLTIGDRLLHRANQFSGFLLQRRLQNQQQIEPYEVLLDRLRSMQQGSHRVTRLAIWRIWREHQSIESSVTRALSELLASEPMNPQQLTNELYQRAVSSHSYLATILRETRCEENAIDTIHVGDVQWTTDHQLASELTSDERRLQHLFANVEASSRRTAAALSGRDFGQPRWVIRDDRRIVAHAAAEALEIGSDLAAVWERAIEQVHLNGSLAEAAAADESTAPVLAVGDISLIRDIAVFPWKQRQGLGMSILRFAIRQLRCEGRIAAIMIEDNRPWAQKLCEENGARFVGWLPDRNSSAGQLENERGENGVSLYLL